MFSAHQLKTSYILEAVFDLRKRPKDKIFFLDQIDTLEMFEFSSIFFFIILRCPLNVLKLCGNMLEINRNFSKEFMLSK